jgi:hypothetical protein
MRDGQQTDQRRALEKLRHLALVHNASAAPHAACYSPAHSVVYHVGPGAYTPCGDEGVDLRDKDLQQRHDGRQRQMHSPHPDLQGEEKKVAAAPSRNQHKYSTSGRGRRPTQSWVGVQLGGTGPGLMTPRVLLAVDVADWMLSCAQTRPVTPAAVPRSIPAHSHSRRLSTLQHAHTRDGARTRGGSRLPSAASVCGSALVTRSGLLKGVGAALAAGESPANNTTQHALDKRAAAGTRHDLAWDVQVAGRRSRGTHTGCHGRGEGGQALEYSAVAEDRVHKLCVACRHSTDRKSNDGIDRGQTLHGPGRMYLAAGTG